MVNAMKGDLLDMGQNIVEVGVDEGAPGVDGCRSRIRRQLEGPSGLAITETKELSR